MRSLSAVFLLLCIAALVVGVSTGAFSISSGMQVFDKLQRARYIAETNIDEVKSVYRDVNRVLAESRSVVDEYYDGSIDNIHDDRIEKIFSNTRDLLGRTAGVRDEVENSLLQVEYLKSEIESELCALLPMAGASAVCLVASGWLFGLALLVGRGNAEDAPGRRRNGYY